VLGKLLLLEHNNYTHTYTQKEEEKEYTHSDSFVREAEIVGGVGGGGRSK
jgi:hypothetical protein